MDLSNLQTCCRQSKHSDNFRRGRGHGSGNGKTAGKGHKGQKARSGAPRTGLRGRPDAVIQTSSEERFHRTEILLDIDAINVSALESIRE